MSAVRREIRWPGPIEVSSIGRDVTTASSDLDTAQSSHRAVKRVRVLGVGDMGASTSLRIDLMKARCAAEVFDD